MCSVVGCGSWRRAAHRFKLPEDPEKRLEWVQFLAAAYKQRFKESSCADITICTEHFTEDCFGDVTGTAQLKPGAVPSLPPSSGPDRPQPSQEPALCDQHKTCNSPSSCSEESGPTSVAVPESPVPSDASEAVIMSGYGQMPPKMRNIDIIIEKAALLQMKGKYVVNEHRLLQLFGSNSLSCGSQVKVEKVIYGVLVVLNQQCLECGYRNAWKSQVHASVPATADENLTRGTNVAPQAASTNNNHGSITGVSETVAVIDEDSDHIAETKESVDEGDVDSDEDWDSTEANEFLNGSSEESDYEDPAAPDLGVQLCTDCGIFCRKLWHHTCEHKIKPFCCNICGKRCVSEISLNSHSKIHDEDYEHRCKYCHVTFKTKVDNITHKQIHVTDGKPYQCPDCSETFATNKERKIHLEGHRGPKQLKCHICGIEFHGSSALQRHSVVHTGLKPFKCSVCQGGFKQAGHLKSHMRLHTGERPYKCQHCDKRFNHNVSLKSHVQRYHLSSECKQKKEKINERASDSGDAQEDGNKRGLDSELDSVDEDQDTDEEEMMYSPKNKRRSTGRPIGRGKIKGK